MTKEAGRQRVEELVQNFVRNEADYLKPTYNETQTRTDFITPLLEAFGWDVYNKSGHPLALREVIEEATVEVGEERLSKKPDYELRLARQRKFFVEAKKPSVHVDRDRAPAFQTRRYGYSASLPISILTNFHQLAVYDCTPVPAETDEAHVGRILLLEYRDFAKRFDDLWPLLAREVVYSGDFDRRFAVEATRRGASQFDDFFLGQVQSWRARLAADIHENTPGLTPNELTYAVQLFLSRIIFLRICEDRDIEKYENLRKLSEAHTFVELMVELRRADAFYDSGLFRLLDDAPLGIHISDEVLHGIIEELYYPQSPYTFAVVETEVLGEIYEQFLGEVIAVEGGQVRIVSKPEVRESGGVVPTPRYIVDAIVERTLVPALVGKGPAELQDFTIVDPCCGSGVFLLSVYEFLLDHYLTWYLSHDRPTHVGRRIYEIAAGQWRMTFEEKRRILVEHIRGVDIDSNAVEVARFSLLLKLIEDESAAGLKDYVTSHKSPALPSLDATLRCGNSLVSPAEWDAACDPMDEGLVEKINPFSWQDEFQAEMAAGGFDVVVANPPYIRIQNMATYSAEEITFYKSPDAPYATARQDNFDKYSLFIERALMLTRQTGRIGVIVPNKFMVTQAGRALRRVLSASRFVTGVVHFGVQPVFGRHVSNYTCILTLDRRGAAIVAVEQVRSLDAWRYGQKGAVTSIRAELLGEDTWQFADAETRAVFSEIRTRAPRTLGEVAEIFVGVQTSADPIYIFKATKETARTVTLSWDDREWTIERGILRPCLHDAPLSAYNTPQPNAWMIFPYEITTDKDGASAHLIQPKEMAAKYPGCLAYLKARRKELAKRKVAGGVAKETQFYQFGRSQSLTKFDSPKIILPILSLEARYAYDRQDIVVTGGGNGPYYMIRPKPGADVSLEVLLAVLNHPVSEAFVRTNTSVFRGGYYSHGKQFIEGLPIPPATDQQKRDVERAVQQLVRISDAAAAARTPHTRTLRQRQVEALRSHLETEVAALFGLSNDALTVIRAVPGPS